MDITIVDWFGYHLSPQERMRHINEAGFSGVLLLWADYFDSDYKDFPAYARDVGLYVENAHAPYMNANFLWEDSINGQDYVREMITCIEDCADHDIPTLVMHPENKNGNKEVMLPNKFDFGIDRLKEIVEVAERLNVNIAIENMSRPEFLAYIFRDIQSHRLGFCFDSGHWNLFMPEIDLLSLYGDRLMALHLHDNDGVNDCHALPFSGNLHWDIIAEKLKMFGYNGALALEVSNARFEYIKEPDKFLRLAVEKTKGLLD
ncbi:MAG: sugar phosphate isomerase/epimerase [Oscillospiraceae bacterium]|nr:sugar phosphate isomerase/epimerase [Oscillospiraceae bacterium]